MDVPEILTPRLGLRAWSDADVEPMAAIYADPEVTRYLQPRDLEATRQQLDRFRNHWTDRGFGIWAIEYLESGKLIGRAGLMHHDDWTASPHDAEVGWVLVRDFWRMGLATEAGSAALKFAFESMRMNRVISVAHRENAASHRVMQKLGMVREGEASWNGSPVVWYAIERDAAVA